MCDNINGSPPTKDSVSSVIERVMSFDEKTDAAELKEALRALKNVPGENKEYQKKVIDLLQKKRSVHTIEDPSSVKQIKKLGAGQYGVVYLAEYKGEIVAQKVPKNPVEISQYVLESFLHEAKMMASNPHPNIIRLVGACLNPVNLMILTEKMDSDLATIIHEKPEIIEDDYVKVKLAYETALGLDYLHNVANIVHFDLKPANILVDKYLVPRLTDFGMSQLIIKGKSTFSGLLIGTPAYNAPEVFASDSCGTPADIYSFALILFELFTLHYPFEGLDADEIRDAVCDRKELPSFSKCPEVPQEIIQLAEKCWVQEQRMRLKADQIVVELANIKIDYEMPPNPLCPDGDESHAASIFWKRHFLRSEFVPWSSLKAVLLSSMEVSSKNLEIIKDYLCDDNPDSLVDYLNGDEPSGSVVTKSQFYKFSRIFGNWFQPSGEPLIDEMINLFSARWYYHYIDPDTITRLLSGQPKGTYLVRLSSMAPVSPFAISYVEDDLGKIDSCRICRSSYDTSSTNRYHRYSDERNYFRTVLEFIEASDFCEYPLSKPL